jgi:glycosyltransferase involved in cell wall biosynthesis
MKKLLYITDQQEYSEHGSIGPLFNGYLREYLDVHIVYFTKFKHSFQVKGRDYIVPQKYQKVICCYLNAKGVELGTFDFVFVRNVGVILEDVLNNRSHYGYRIGFRASFPKTVEAYEAMKAEEKATWFSGLSTQYKTYKKRKLIQQCDLFMPISKDMQETFYGEGNPVCFPLPAGLDPQRIRPHEPAPHAETRFIYVGTLDTLRQFGRVLEALERLASQPWHLTISTQDLTYAKKLLAAHPAIGERVDIVRAESLEELTAQINGCDVGIALLPSIPLFDTSIPAKVMEYYTCAIPAVVTDNAKNRTLFDSSEAIYSAFEPDAIVKTLGEVIAMPRDAIAAIGEAGQRKILGMKRNYAIMARELAERLDTL